MTEANIGTLIQYAAMLRWAYLAENPGLTAREYDECDPVVPRLLDWCAALYAAARRGEMIPARVLDDLAKRDRRLLLSLMHDYGGSIPVGYLPPDVRRLNREHEAELRAARRAGRQRAKEVTGE